MTRSNEQDTILAHPALAGHTLLIQQEGRWLVREIRPEGRLGESRAAAQIPLADGWRGGWIR